MPRFEIEGVEDAYTYYVLLLGIPEGVFWYADPPFVQRVAENKSAYDAWDACEREKEIERAWRR